MSFYASARLVLFAFASVPYFCAHAQEVTLTTAGAAAAVDEPVLIDHFVAHTSTVYSLAGQEVMLFVRERVKHGFVKSDARNIEGRVVLLIHGASIPSEAVFDTPMEGYSVMDFLAKHGMDVFAMDLTSFGMSTRPTLMDDKCNVPVIDAGFIAPRGCPPDALGQPTMPHPFVVRSADTDMDDLNSVIDYVRALRSVERVHLVGYGEGGRTAGRYAILHPEKVDRLVLLAPTYERTSRLNPPAALPERVRTNPNGLRLPTAGSVQVTTKQNFISGWNSQIACEQQVESGVQDPLWDIIQATDPVGASWGDGVLRFTLTAFWEWNSQTVGQVQAPTLLISGLLSNAVPNTNANVERLFSDMTAKSRVFLSVECTGHQLFWEKQRGLIAKAIHHWLVPGNLAGLTCGTALALEEGTILPTSESCPFQGQ